MSLSLKRKNNSQIKRLKAPNIISHNNNNKKLNYQKYLYKFKIDFFSNKKSIHLKALTPNHYELKKYYLSKEINLLPPKLPEYLNKKTLILDLDETLVHSSFLPFPKNDIILNVQFDGNFYKIYVLVRPGAEEFIKNISQYYELVTFTASLSKYASPLLDILDKEKNIQHRLYRESCTLLNGIYIKSLKKIGRNMKDLIIVDNSPLAYAFDRDNGLPISSWFGDKGDKELYDIMPLLIFLSKTDDVRKFTEKFVFFDKIDYSKAYKIIDKEESIEKIVNNNNEGNKEEIIINDFINNTNDKSEDKKVVNEDLKYVITKDNDINNNYKNNVPFLVNNTKSNSIKTKLYQNININSLEIVNSKKNKENINKNKDEKKLNLIVNKKNNLTSNNNHNDNKKKNLKLFINLTQRNIKGNKASSKNKRKMPLTLGISNTCKNIFAGKKKNNCNNNYLISNFYLYKNKKNNSNVNIFNNKDYFFKTNNNINLKTINQNKTQLNYKDLLFQYNNNKILNKKTKNRYSSFRNKAIYADYKPKIKKHISSSMHDKEIINVRNGNRKNHLAKENNKIKISPSYNANNYKINTEFNIKNISEKKNIFNNNKTDNNI